MTIHIRLNKPIDAHSLLGKIENKIREHGATNDLDNSILSIEIKTIAHISNELILKLEHTLEKLDDDRKHDLPESA